ncbi:hypothetical protein SH1V18_27380 [Vallitalea longa]|uniref:DUF2726 domain-containing protein n=1 Tax=Vallitalea longa TaxID=2936439 RepID=A0A9W6DGA3_9FIRM|nr:DUF2726 domain-containing protein [Vallitalea longa]GKX30258.1 hypothetical protein SH1V18_27380 [Vallitalea longa]
MDTIIYALIVIVIAAILIKIFTSKVSQNKKNDYSTVYKDVDSILTKAELKFYNTLYDVCIDLDVTLFTKVRVADIVKVKSKDDYMSYFNKICSKHIDFVICDNRTLKPIICLELDDSSHNRKDRIERDKFINEVLTSIGYGVIHIPCKYKYDKEAIESKLEEALNNH